MSDEKPSRRRLEGERSPAATSPAAEHEDAMSPSRTLRERDATSQSQRVGDNTPTGNPYVSFPDESDLTGERDDAQ
jgi:hypothetical protein